MSRLFLLILAVVTIGLVDLVSATYVSNEDWNKYKNDFNKAYTDSISESNARYYFAYNKQWIAKHNALFELGLKTYTLKINQFSDMRFIHFRDLFPVATATGPSFDSPLPVVRPAAPSYDPIQDFDVVSNIENQGTKCNSGWAYAAAKSIELFQAYQTGLARPSSLSAQNLIDCAGRAAACKNQVPQAAFDFLTRYSMDLHLESNYNNNNNLSAPGMCTPKGDAVTKLGSYARLLDGDDELLKAYVSTGMPVVIEFNPTSFEFMHYAEGVFQQPSTSQGSHFMVVIGYGTIDGKDYWLLQNSFDTTWGEKGLMKLQRTPTNKITKNAIFPIELA